jgi:uncharacterized membrane protein
MPNSQAPTSGASPDLNAQSSNTDTQRPATQTFLPSSHYRWLLLWSLIALGIRLWGLTLKPAWMDEVATAIYSLGNSAYFLPLDQVVGLGDMLAPLRPRPEASVFDVIHYLTAEDRHPPLYFAISHLWQQLFPTDQGILAVGAARSGSAVLGALIAPALYFTARVTFQSPTAGLMAAALAALSPINIALAQEARHYGLAATLVALSLGFFALGLRAIWQRRSLPKRLYLGWIVINVLGFATHYFASLTYIAMALVLLAVAFHQVRHRSWQVLQSPSWWGIAIAALGTGVGMASFAPLFLHLEDSSRAILSMDLSDPMAWINPVLQTLAAWLQVFFTPMMFFATHPLHIGLMVAFGLALLAYLATWAPTLWRMGKGVWQQSNGQVGLYISGGFLLAIMGVYAGICYGYGADITRGLRYAFPYYPAVIVLGAGIVANRWSSSTTAAGVVRLWGRWPLTSRRWVQGFITVMGLCALLVSSNLAIPKVYGPERFVPFVQAHSQHPVVLATVEPLYEPGRVIGIEFLSIVWELHRHFHPDNPEGGWLTPPQFLAMGLDPAQTEPPFDQRLGTALALQTRPFDFWILHSQPDLSTYGCSPAADMLQGNKASYVYNHQVCQ